MENPQSFNPKQREMFARLLQEAREREEVELGSVYVVDKQVEAEIVPKLAKEHGALALIERVRNLRKEVEESEKTLGTLGFSCDEDSIALENDAPKAIREALETAQRSAQKERQAVLKRYDHAILGVWAAESAEEARKIVEKLL